MCSNTIHKFVCVNIEGLPSFRDDLDLGGPTDIFQYCSTNVRCSYYKWCDYYACVCVCVIHATYVVYMCRLWYYAIAIELGPPVEWMRLTKRRSIFSVVYSVLVGANCFLVFWPGAVLAPFDAIYIQFKWASYITLLQSENKAHCYPIAINAARKNS